MDFIQSAIQKARSERLRRGDAPGTPQAGAEGAAPDSAVSEGGAVADAAPDAAAPGPGRAEQWSGIAEFRADIPRLERNRVLSVTGGGDAMAFDIMRTKLLHQMRRNNWSRLAITSPTPACGKTTLALNLAFSLARQPDVFSMLVEFDMRRPSMLEVLGLKENCQFAEVLMRHEPAEAHMLRFGANLLLAPNRRPTPNAAELLQQVETGKVMDEVEKRFAPDVMIFDMPPMLATDDTLAFIDQIDCVLLVAAAGSTTAAELDRCGEELTARCNFLGVVLNKCRYLEGGDAYGYGAYGRYGY